MSGAAPAVRHRQDFSSSLTSGSHSVYLPLSQHLLAAPPGGGATGEDRCIVRNLVFVADIVWKRLRHVTVVEMNGF